MFFNVQAVFTIVPYFTSKPFYKSLHHFATVFSELRDLFSHSKRNFRAFRFRRFIHKVYFKPEVTWRNFKNLENSSEIPGPALFRMFWQTIFCVIFCNSGLRKDRLPLSDRNRSGLWVKSIL